MRVFHKKLLSLLLVAAMVFSFVPASSISVRTRAAEEDILTLANAMDFSDPNNLPDYCPACGEKNVTWNKISLRIGYGKSGHWYVPAGGVALDPITNNFATVDVDSTLCIHLNGQPVSYGSRIGASATGAVVNIMGGNGGSITLLPFTDSAEIAAKNGSDIAALDANGAQMNIYGGSYTTTDPTRPILKIRNSGEVNVYGATFDGNHTARSIWVENGNLTLNNTTVQNGKSDLGGNLRLSSGAVTVTGGKITGGEATTGHNVYVEDGTFQAAEGIVDGGIYYVADDPSVILTKANAMDFSDPNNLPDYCPACGEKNVTWNKISSRIGYGKTGHWYVPAGGVALDPITNNFATVDAGGTLCIHLNGQPVSYGSRIGASVTGAVVNIMGGNGGSITLMPFTGDAQSAATNGSDIAALDVNGAQMNIYGGSYTTTDPTRPILKIRGGGIANVYSAVFDGNHTARSIWVENGNLTLHNTTVQNGKSDLGGNLRLSGGAVTVTGGKITGGEATTGHNVYVEDGTFQAAEGIVDGGFHCAHIYDLAQGNQVICRNCGDTQIAVASVNDIGCLTIEEALAVEEGTIKLLQDVENITADKALFLDLNGFAATNVTATKIYASDSSATAEKAGTGVLTTDCEVVMDHTTKGIRYIALEENGSYTFHVLEMRLSAVSLRATKDCGIYYKAVYALDDVLKEKIDRFGVVLSLNDMPGEDFETETGDRNGYTAYSKERFVSGTEVTSGAVVGIMKAGNANNKTRGKMQIYSTAYIKIDGRTMVGAGAAYSLLSVMQAIDENWSKYVSAGKEQILKNFYAMWKDEGMDNWEAEIPHIAGGEGSDAMILRATALKTNNLDTPLGVDTVPVFGWTNRSAAVGRAQSAYQIIVSSTEELAAQHIGDLWDTGKVASDVSFDIAYAGEPLTSRTDYYWSVRVWDETDTPSEFTKAARFGTGILNQEKWLGKWIGGTVQTSGRETTPAPMLRKSFTLSSAVKKAKVFVCGLGLYEMKINGQLPDDSVLNPADTQYEDTVSYNVYDVTALLQEGKNAVTVELGNGFFNLTDPISVGFNTGKWRDDPKLMLELHVEYENGETETVVSDETWRCYADGPIRVNSIYLGEQYDASKEVAGWTEADFDDTGWANVRMAAEPTGKLKFENMEPMRRVSATKKTIEKLSAGTYWISADHFCTGWAKFTFKNTTPGQTIQIRYLQRESERAAGLTVTDEKLPLQTYTYVCKGADKEIYEPKFSYAGYQYIEVTGYDGTLQPDDVICYTVATDVEHIGSFETGNAMVNQLHEMMVRTMICNMQGKPTDTPIFEKLGWTGDYNGAIKTFNYNFDVSSFLGHFLYNLRDSALPSGEMNEYSPSGYTRSGYDSPTWTQMYTNSMYAAWHENGQFSLIKEHYDYMLTQADYYITRINQGDEPWVWEGTGMANRLGDWASPHGSISPTTAPPEGGTLYNTAAVHRVLTEMVEICQQMGDAENAKRYQEAADNIYEAFNRVFYNAEKGIYETADWNGSTTRTKYRQACNLVPLYYGLCPEEYHDRVLNNLLEDIRLKGNHLDVGSVGAEIILPLLSREGHGDLAMKILLQKDHPSWGYWLELGATTAWEAWSTKILRSLCHYFLGTYDEWFYQNLAGIQDARNGYETVTIRPEVFPELGYVKASKDTVRGELISSWQVDENNRLTMSVTVPVGTTADILLPIAESGNVLLNGQALSLQPGVLEIGTAGDRTLVRVVSGTYNFDLGILQ